MTKQASLNDKCGQWIKTSKYQQAGMFLWVIRDDIFGQSGHEKTTKKGERNGGVS